MDMVIKLKKIETIYEPAEDSYLFQKILKEKIPLLLKKNSDLKILDMGTGSGILAETCFNLGVKRKNILCSDVNNKAIKLIKKKVFNCIQSNLFEKIKKEKFNIIIFNPPYLPKNKKEPKESQIATTGGKQGSEIINKFLGQAENFLEKNGKIFLLTSSLTKNIKWINWNKKLIAKKKLFFEELRIWEIESNNNKQTF